jgi:hypothetical protein
VHSGPGVVKTQSQEEDAQKIHKVLGSFLFCLLPGQERSRRPKEILVQQAGSWTRTGLSWAIFVVAAACVNPEGVSCAAGKGIMGSPPSASATALKAVTDEAEIIAGWEREQKDIRSRISEVFCVDPHPQSCLVMTEFFGLPLSW